jgi:ketosteroid isomerase-like protein
MIDVDIESKGARNLSPEEVRNTATACEQMAAAMAGWRDADEGRRRLEAIQSPNLDWFTPSSNPHREIHQGRAAYVALVAEFQFDFYIPGSKVAIFATTAQRNRVATEMISDIVLKDGTPYTNRYQQLFVFDAAGKVVTYKLYMDTAIFIRDDNRATAKIAEDFLYALSTSGTLGLRYLLTDDATWTFASKREGSVTLGKEATLARVDQLQQRFDGFGFEAIPKSAIVNGAQVSIGAMPCASAARADGASTAEYRFVIETQKPQEMSHAGRILGGKISRVREYVRGNPIAEI